MLCSTYKINNYAAFSYINNIDAKKQKHHETADKTKGKAMKTAVRNRARTRPFSGFSPLKALLRADQNYREREHMRSLTDDQLKDVGLTRQDLR